MTLHILTRLDKSTDLIEKIMLKVDCNLSIVCTMYSYKSNFNFITVEVQILSAGYIVFS